MGSPDMKEAVSCVLDLMAEGEEEAGKSVGSNPTWLVFLLEKG